jgi:hypothetical protein
MTDAIIIADSYNVTQFIGPAVLGYFVYWMGKEMALLNDPMHTIFPLLVFCGIVIAISMANTDRQKYEEFVDGPPDTARELKYQKRTTNNICLLSFAILGGGFFGMSLAWNDQKQQKFERERREKETAEKETKEDNQ